MESRQHSKHTKQKKDSQTEHSGSYHRGGQQMGKTGKGGKENLNVRYLDLDDSYTNIYPCQNSLSCMLRFEHFIVCTSILK